MRESSAAELRLDSPPPLGVWPEDGPEDPVLQALDAGDPDHALTLLMRLHGQAIYRFCRQMLPEDEMARDVHQMTFVQAYEGFGSFRRQSSLKSWLFSIARNRCLDAIKMRRRRLARIEPVPDLPENAGDEPGVEEALASRSVVRMLEYCLGTLAPRTRMAVLLRFREEISYPEMGRICGEQAATLQARVARALPALRRCLEAKGAAL